MNTTMLRRLFLLFCLVIFAGASCQRSSDEPLAPQDDPHQVEDSLIEPFEPVEPEPQPEGDGYEPASTGDRIEIEPEEPAAGEEIKVRAGPLTFRNGCEGIERSWAEPPDEAGRILLRWAPRVVPPDAMCTMALHSQWLEVTIEGLAAGEYLLVAEGIGERRLVVGETD